MTPMEQVKETKKALKQVVSLFNVRGRAKIAKREKEFVVQKICEANETHVKPAEITPQEQFVRDSFLKPVKKASAAHVHMEAKKANERPALQALKEHLDLRSDGEMNCPLHQKKQDQQKERTESILMLLLSGCVTRQS